jgi:hypothetical protein
MAGTLAALRRTLGLDTRRRRPAASLASADSPLSSYLESQRWLERSQERCQCPATIRFLGMIRSRIAARIAEESGTAPTPDERSDGPGGRAR